MNRNMKLLQTLLSNRQEIILLYKNLVFCSCGEEFDDYTDVENHIVGHAKIHENCNDNDHGNSLSDTKIYIKEALKELLRRVTSVKTDNLARTIYLPEKVCSVTLEEDDINYGQLQEMSCPECHIQINGGFPVLKSHYLKHHPWLWEPHCPKNNNTFLRKLPQKTEYSTGWTFRFYCPIPDCKYHILTSDGKYFKSKMDIKQHYAKVHGSKKFLCQKCELKFPTEVYLKRHQSQACGKSFKCNFCPKSYSIVENLKTHCRRKNHPFALKSNRLPSKSTSKQLIPVIDVSHLMTSVLPQRIVATTVPRENSRQVVRVKCENRIVKIAPNPSPLHMSAAIALSELAGNPNQTLLMPANGPPALISRPSNSTQVQTAITGCLVNVCEQETQTSLLSRHVLNITPCTSTNTFLSAEKLNWTSSTQTSPRIVSIFDTQDLMKSSTRDFSTHIDETDLMHLNEDNFSNQGLISKRRVPHLGEIEQYSTETQTETDFDLLKKPRLTNSPPSDVDDDPLFSAISRTQTEAETQFDLDDILCSNYTQTGDNYDFSSFLHRMDDDSCPSPVTFNSSKTQTTDTSLGGSSNLFHISQSNPNLQQNNSHGDPIHMETQTTLDDILSFPRF